MSASNRATLAVIIVAKNEAADIGDCIRSVRDWADDVIVFDSGSTDGTQDICRQLGARMFETDWPGYGEQSNRALREARTDWVLSLDADERISPELRAEMIAVLESGSSHTVYSMPRSSSFCGRFMKHSGWWPDRIRRFFKREQVTFFDAPVHSHLVFAGTVGDFRAPIIHYSIPDLKAALDKANDYSTAGAAAAYAKGKRASLGSAIGHGLWAFIRTYIIQRGFLDGAEGFMLAVSNAEGTYYRYIKLMMLHRHGKR